MSNESAYKNPLYWYYGSASVSIGVKNNAFSYLLLIFSTQVLGIPGYQAAIALGIAMLWDAVTDLFIGHWSDKTRSRLGRRHPFMYISLLILPFSFYALFNPVIDLDETNRWYYLLILSIFIRSGVTLAEVPSVALLPELVKDYDERNKWLALRHAFGWYGGNGIHAFNMWLWVGAYGVAVQTGYGIYAAVGAILIALSIIISSVGTQQAAASMPQPTEPLRIREIWSEMRQIAQSLSNENFLWLFIYSLIVGAAAGLSTALYLYNVSYFFQFSGPQIAVTAIFVFFSPGVAMWLAPKLGLALGKKQTAILAICGAILLYPIPYIGTLVGFWPEAGSSASLYIYSFFVFAEVVGFIVGGVMLDSMMADIVEDSEVKTNRRSEGLFYAARSFAAKAVSALGIILAGSIVSMVGLDGIKEATEMTDSMRMDLATFFLPLYCGLYFLAIYLVSKYRIDRDTHNANLEKLNKEAWHKPQEKGHGIVFGGGTDGGGGEA